MEHWRKWTPASGLPNGRWRVTRYRHGNGVTLEELRKSNGALHTFPNYEKAKAKADDLNRCDHPANSLFAWTINDPATDDAGDVIYEGGNPVYRTLLVSACKCGEVLPAKELNRFQVDYDKHGKDVA
jgi:hypothetical protein